MLIFILFIFYLFIQPFAEFCLLDCRSLCWCWDGYLKLKNGTPHVIASFLHLCRPVCHQLGSCSPESRWRITAGRSRLLKRQRLPGATPSSSPAPLTAVVLRAISRSPSQAPATPKKSQRWTTQPPFTFPKLRLNTVGTTAASTLQGTYISNRQSLLVSSLHVSRLQNTHLPLHCKHKSCKFQCNALILVAKPPAAASIMWFVETAIAYYCPWTTETVVSYSFSHSELKLRLKMCWTERTL